MSDLTVVDTGEVVVVPVHFFPTARRGAVSIDVPAFTNDGRSRAIEFFLANGGTPERFAAARRYFDVRAEAGPGVEWPGLDLEDEDLSGFDLSRANLTGAVLGTVSGADFRHARMDWASVVEAAGAEFDFADLHQAVFVGARLERASFSGARLRGATFEESSLRRARFAGADISGADFTGADLTGTDLQFVLAANNANFTEAEGLTDEQRQSLYALGAAGLGRVWVAPLLDLEFSA